MAKEIEEKYKQLQRARDTMCLVYGIPYKKVLKLQTELEVNGMTAYITTGGLQILANYQDARVVRICKKYNTVADPGVSRFAEKAVLGITKPITDPEAFSPKDTEDQ